MDGHHGDQRYDPVMADKIKARIIGTEKLVATLNKMSLEAKNNIVQALNKGAIVVHKTAGKSIQQSSGSFKENSKGHFSSPPGAPPNADTGNLARRLRIKPAKAAELEAQVISGAKYSADLEFGTRNMAARPFMAPSFRDHVKNIKNAVAKAIRKGLTEGNS